MRVLMGLTVSRQTAQNLTENRQKTAIFAVNRPKRGSSMLTVKWFQGISNLTILLAHHGLLALKESSNL